MSSAPVTVLSTRIRPPVSGAGNAGPLIWAPPGMVIDGGGNQGPCEPQPNPDLTCF